MKITGIEIFTRNLTLTKPYTIAYKTISDVENVFLLITLENGIVGIGAANPDLQVVGESAADVLKTCRSDFFQRFKGRSIKQFRAMIDEIEAAFPQKPGTLALWDIALHDAFAKYLHIPIAGFYGLKMRALPTSVTIGIMSVSDTLNEAREYVKRGFKVLKIKTGQQVDVDIERVIKVHEQFGKVKIRVDANQGYNVDELKKFIRATKGLGLEVIEQPLQVGEEEKLLQLAPDSRKILVADESLKNSRSALKFANQPQPFGAFNIKLMKCGGIKGAFEIATIAQAAGINLFWGCNDESSISISAALHAAFASKNTRYIDLDGSFDLAEDIVKGGFKLKDGLMYLTEQPGLGAELLDTF